MASNYVALVKHSQDNNRFTKDCLKTALISMVRDHSLQDISITKLCEKAGVSRMAFYRNYSVVNDIFHEIACDLNDEVVKSVGSPFRTNTTEEWYIEVFQLIAKNKEVMAIMFQREFQYEWMRTVNSFAVHSDDFSDEKTYQRLMWSGGFENAVSHWLNHNLAETPEEMASFCIKYLPHLLNN